jgi:hypothetical protein
MTGRHFYYVEQRRADGTRRWERISNGTVNIESAYAALREFAADTPTTHLVRVTGTDGHVGNTRHGEHA